MLVGCTFLVIILVILLIFCKNVSINVNITYPEPKFIEVKDQFDDKGNPVDPETKATIDDVLKVVNSIMLGQEEDNDA